MMRQFKFGKSDNPLMNRVYRPRIKLPFEPLDKILEALTFGALLFLWGYTLQNYASLADTVPVHFNAAGQADDYGSKTNIWILPVIATVLVAGLTVLNFFPHIFNYPVTITAANAKRQYLLATRFMRIMKLALVVIFSMIMVMMIKSQQEGTGELGTWFLPVVLCITIIPVIIYFIISRQPGRNS